MIFLKYIPNSAYTYILTRKNHAFILYFYLLTLATAASKPLLRYGYGERSPRKQSTEHLRSGPGLSASWQTGSPCETAGRFARLSLTEAPKHQHWLSVQQVLAIILRKASLMKMNLVRKHASQYASSGDSFK